MTAPNLTTGLLAAIGVIFIWSGFIVFSRAGVVSGLTPGDIVALRFAVAGLITLPFAWAWWPRHLSFGTQALLALCGPGFFYSMLMFTGLAKASAAYGGVFSNGSLPIFTMILVLLVSGERPSRPHLIATGVIVTGAALLGWRGMAESGPDVATGIALFLTASAILSVYIYGVRRWQLTPRQALAVVNIPNAVIFLPLWWLALPSTMAGAEPLTVLLQALFQGLGPGFLALILFSLAAYHLGPGPTSAVSASVPATATLLAIPVLGEIPAPIEWAGIAVVTVGLGMLLRAR